jgi:hypothetical protein
MTTNTDQARRGFLNMLQLVREGDLLALQDLIRFLRSEPSLWHYEDSGEPSVVRTLADLLVSAPRGSPQRREIESLQGLHIYRLIKELLEHECQMRRLRVGGYSALCELIRNVRQHQSKPYVDELARYFLSEETTAQEKGLIWAFKDEVVYKATWKEEEQFEILYYGMGTGRYETRTVTHTQKHTFREYLQQYYSSEIERLRSRE